VPFSTSPARRKVFTRPAEASCPSRIECSLCPAFRRLSFSRPSFPKTARVTRSVLVRSNNRLPSGQLRFAHGTKPPVRYLTRLEAASHRFSSRGFLFRVSGCARTPPEEPVNTASPTAAFTIGFRGTEPTSLAQSFPGRPGLSVRRLRNFRSGSQSRRFIKLSRDQAPDGRQRRFRPGHIALSTPLQSSIRFFHPPARTPQQRPSRVACPVSGAGICGLPCSA
jgi:hypothetical protein